MRSKTTRRFRALLAELPSPLREQARQAYRLFANNPAHPGLSFKPVHPNQPIYSARIGLGFRAVAVLEGDLAVWFWIGSHADYDKLLRKL